MQITAAVAHKPGADFTLETLNLDNPRDGEVLVKIRSVGVCHTDLAAKDGHIPFPMPAVLGHEGAGVVVEVGAGVTKVKPGDKVALTFNSCGECRNCGRGKVAYCYQTGPENFAGFRLDGSQQITAQDGSPVGNRFFAQSSFASHALASERNVVKLADDADLDLAGPLGCGVQTGAGAVVNSMAVEAGSTLVVIGGGSVGLSAALAGVIQGCEKIIVVEPYESRRALALELGATHVIDPAAGPLDEQVKAITPEGAHYMFDTTGIPAVIESAVSAVAPNGTIGLVGVPADPTATVSMSPLGAVLGGIRVLGILEGDAVPDEFIPTMAQWHAEGRFPYDKMITKFPFDQINEAIDAQSKGEVVKVVLVNDDDHDH